MVERTGQAKGLVVQNLDLLTAPEAAFRAITGWDVRFLNSRFSNSFMQALLCRLGVRPMSLESQANLKLADYSQDSPFRAAESLALDMDLEPILDFLASRYVRIPHAREAFRLALISEIAKDPLGIFLTDTWMRSRDTKHARVVARTSNESLVFERMGTPADILAPPAGLSWLGRMAVPEKLTSSFSTHRSRLRNLLISGGGGHGLDDPVSAQSEQVNRADASVLMIFNNSDRYGNLYRYDHLFSSDPKSPLYRSNTALISRYGGAMSGGSLAERWPLGGSRVSRRRRSHAIWLRLKTLNDASVPDGALRFLARLSARVDLTAEEVRLQYPRAKVACLMYEIQVPSYLSLALDAAGIKTIALHERPETAFAHDSTITASTVLAGSPFLAKSLMVSSSTAISVTEPVGMWRTDLLHQAKSQAAKYRDELLGKRFNRLVVALPYHVEHDPLRASDPIATSAETMEHFLDEVIRVADTWPDVLIIIRAKQIDWLEDERLWAILRKLHSRSNIDVSTDYAALNETYRLCSAADLIIGKASSILDECLSLDIPTVIHDYTWNVCGARQRILTYLPRELWALDSSELLHRVSFCLEGRGASFRQWWEGYRRKIYGENNDGAVRERARSRVLQELDRP